MSTYVRAPQGGDPKDGTFKSHRRARRRVTKNGNSNTISIPPEFMSRLGILPAGEVDLVLYEEEGGFFVKPFIPTGLSARAGNP